MLFLILLIVFLISLSSYQWIDPALFLMLKTAHPTLIPQFINGNSHLLQSFPFFILISIWTFAQIWLLFHPKTITRKTALIIFLITLLAIMAYPFLSHDIFTYIFSGKMAWCYHTNPYATLPQAFFQKDLWIGFTHWIDVKYAYGPVMLLKDVFPFVILGCHKFISLFYLFKLINGLLFLATGYLLWLKNKRSPLVLSYWFLNPLLILEILINNHNDILMIFLFVLSVYFFETKKNKIVGGLLALASVLTKQVSLIFLPALLLHGKTRISFIKISLAALFLFLGFRTISMPWYYTWVFLAIPFFQFKKRSWTILFLFNLYWLLNTYWNFLNSGLWGESWWNHFWLLKIILPLTAIFL